MLDYVGYGLDELRREYRAKVAAAGLPAGESDRLNVELEAGLVAYTYLKDEPL
jgi:arginine decarboxylase